MECGFLSTLVQTTLNIFKTWATSQEQLGKLRTFSKWKARGIPQIEQRFLNFPPTASLGDLLQILYKVNVLPIACSVSRLLVFSVVLPTVHYLKGMDLQHGKIQTAIYSSNTTNRQCYYSMRFTAICHLPRYSHWYKWEVDLMLVQLCPTLGLQAAYNLVEGVVVMCVQYNENLSLFW